MDERMRPRSRVSSPPNGGEGRVRGDVSVRRRREIRERMFLPARVFLIA
jgi:hypothetical protein